jgi:hypothetical protein
MKIKLVAAVALVALFAAPAFAANQFYIVQDVKTKILDIWEPANFGGLLYAQAKRAPAFGPRVWHLWDVPQNVRLSG